MSALRSLVPLTERLPITVEALTALRAHIADVVTGGPPSGPPRPTGFAELDAVLQGGIPRGRLTEIVGQAGSGITTLVQAVIARTLADGGWVAVIDATRTLAPRDWGQLIAAYGPRLWMVRPPLTERRRAAWCADLLLRTGAFALVVLDGAPVVRRATGVRLGQLAREQDAALVALRYGPRASDLGGAVRLHVRALPRATATSPRRDRGAQRLQHLREHGPDADEGTDERLCVVVERGGNGHGQQQVEVTCGISVADRLCAHPEVPDRRGVARRTRHKWDVADQAIAGAVAGGGAAPAPVADRGTDTRHGITVVRNVRTKIPHREAKPRAAATAALGRAPARAR
jgi:recombination protein RecA